MSYSQLATLKGSRYIPSEASRHVPPKGSRRALFISLVMFGLLAVASAARADAVVDWSVIATRTILAGGRPTPAAMLDFAAVHLAIHDAVQAIEGRYETYLPQVPGASGSPSAAVAKAAFDVLVTRFPSQSAQLTTDYNSYIAALILSGLAVPNDPGLTGV